MPPGPRLPFRNDRRPQSGPVPGLSPCSAPFFPSPNPLPIKKHRRAPRSRGPVCALRLGFWTGPSPRTPGRSRSHSLLTAHVTMQIPCLALGQRLCATRGCAGRAESGCQQAHPRTGLGGRGSAGPRAGAGAEGGPRGREGGWGACLGRGRAEGGDGPREGRAGQGWGRGRGRAEEGRVELAPAGSSQCRWRRLRPGGYPMWGGGVAGQHAGGAPRRAAPPAARG
jgi:hypothetical protein